MATIVLTAVNARFAHSSLALRYLKANLGKLEAHTEILEFVIDNRACDIAEKILLSEPQILGFSVYLWNLELCENVIHIIKKIRPELPIVLGGPEVSYPLDFPKIVDYADYVITGEGEIAFKNLCTDLLYGKSPGTKIIPSVPFELDSLCLPYNLYTDEDIANRVIYVESTRGCPFGCEFCLSSVDRKVRRFPVNQIMREFDHLWSRGVRRFKFIDRTLHLAATPELLRFFIDRQKEDIFVHFELVPDHISENLFALLAQFKPGTLQLEIGVQTFNPEVARLICRKQNIDQTCHNILRLQKETEAHLHTDLVMGLPGENVESFADGFDKLLSCAPQEIQVGVLKRLRGAPIARHDVEWQMRYNDKPPYEILQNRLIDFHTMQRLKRFARFFDLFCNSGNFITSVHLIWQHASPFVSFLHFTDWLYEKLNRSCSIALNRLAGMLFLYLCEVIQVNKNIAANHISADYTRLNRRNLPSEVQAHVTIKTHHESLALMRASPSRQRRHSAK